MASAAGRDLIEKRDEKNVLTSDSSILPFLPSLLSPMTKTNNHNTTVYVCRCHIYSFRHLFQPQALLDSSGEVILNIPEQLEPYAWRRPHPYLAQTHWLQPLGKWKRQVHQLHQSWRGQILTAHIASLWTNCLRSRIQRSRKRYFNLPEQV